MMVELLHDSTLAEQPHDLRRGPKGAKHEGDTTVLVDVRNGFTATASGVEVSDGIGTQYAKCARQMTFRGDIDMFACPRGTCDEEERLCGDELDMMLVERGIVLDHVGG